MTREDFIKKCAAMGVGISLISPLLTSCGSEEDILIVPNFTGKVLIIGAGAAGLMAGYTLKQRGIDFQIIEANSDFGGRVKMTDSFADFPIDLGAEWIHTTPKVFSELVNDKSVDGSIDLIPYKADSLQIQSGNRVLTQNWFSTFYGEYKFKSTTWYQFFEKYIVPSIKDEIVYNSPITSIDYSVEGVSVEDVNGNTYSADRVIVTVPLNILKNNSISFTPDLPTEKTQALAKTSMPPGIKVFIKCEKKFYPDIFAATTEMISGDSERIYYDAAFKKDSNDHILALFNVGPNAAEFTDLDSDEKIIEAVLAELDAAFDGQASKYYQGHIIQNWAKEPYIEGAYSFGGENYYDNIATISRPINRKVFFAGEALNEDAWATVHGAGFSGIETVQRLLQT